VCECAGGPVVGCGNKVGTVARRSRADFNACKTAGACCVCYETGHMTATCTAAAAAKGCPPTKAFLALAASRPPLSPPAGRFLALFRHHAGPPEERQEAACGR
jgi:hypothetical protein